MSEISRSKLNWDNEGMFSRCVFVLQNFWFVLVFVVFGLYLPLSTFAQTTVTLAQTPLLALKTAPGLVMLTMSRDQRLYFTAYNDGIDLDGDGTLEAGYKESIPYYGYFVSDRCYKYDTGVTPNRFLPVELVNSSTGCTSSTGRWHGNWLNWMTTSRMDALRKVLYGGKRSTDSSSTTVLEAAHIPPDAHIWGHEYRPVASQGVDAYDITKYTPLSTPAAGKMHLFMMKSEGTSTSPYIGTGVPSLRIVQNVDSVIDRLWLWVSSERPVGGAAGTTQYKRPAGNVSNPSAGFIGYGLPGFSSGTSYVAVNYNYAFNLFIRVQACVDLGVGIGRETGCTGYPTSGPTSWKPTGVLHDYSVNDNLKFGLLTGSYTLNYSGGVLRKDIGSFSDEFVASTGVFNSATNGIVKTINGLTTYGFNISDQTYLSNSTNAVCPSNTFMWNRLRCEGEVNMWGAPVAEMMYEGLRYFTDKQPTAAFSTGVSSSTSPDSKLSLPLVTTWKNPFRPKASGGSPICSRPVQMVIADPITSFDSDQLPGASFSPNTGFGSALGTGDLTGLNVSTEADKIWTSEFGAGTTKNFFIGQSTISNSDGNPSAKSANSFKLMRGLAPDETNTQGSYYSGSIAKFGRETGVPVRAATTDTPTTTKVDTISVALGTVVPKIQMSYGGNTISLIPFTKSVAGCSPAPAVAKDAANGFQPTGLIAGIFIDRLANTGSADVDLTVNGGRPFARFMVSFSDMDIGGDNESDANAYYTLSIDASGKLVVQINNYYWATCSEMHMGYAISGTNADGVYLEVRALGSGGTQYYLDTMPGELPATNVARSPLHSTAGKILSASSATRTFTLATSTSGASYVPKDPLWYAAKYGGPGVFDSKGDPTNYFKVTNPNELPAQMGKAFRSAAALAAVASTSVVGVGQRSLGTAAIYQANYDSLTWSSRLYSFSVLSTGVVSDTTLWEASIKIPATVSSRTNLFLGRGGSSAPIALVSGSTGYTSLTAAEQTNFGNLSIYDYLLGDKSQEERKGGIYRNRGTTSATEYGSVLGDIVNSDPQIISKKDYGYSAGDASYTTFLGTLVTESLAVGTNNGFFHIFNAAPTVAGGGELLGFIPQAASTNIKDLASTSYSHRYFVDGSIGLGHAKIAVPGDSSVLWRQVVVAAGGAGVKSVFAIDATSQAHTANSILWEINENTVLPTGFNGTLGNVMGRPAIGKLKNGVWVAIFGNGYNSTVGTANLLVVRLSDGVILKEIRTNDLILSNGMGSAEIVKSTSGFQDTIDYVYGADYKGNIWRFDLSGVTASNTGWPATGALVYSTPTGRPITAEIKIGPATGTATITGGKMIYFGTGTYLNATDAVVTSPAQALYGIYDDLVWTSNLSANAVEANLESMTLVMPSSTSDKRSSSIPATPWYNLSGKKGWRLVLSGTNVTAGERVIAPPVRYTVAGQVDSFLFTSIVPGTDDCIAGIDAWITGIDAMSGGGKPVFDGIGDNSVKITGGSPRGVFVLQDGGDPALYISQTIFNGNISTTSFTTSTGGQQSVSINGTVGQTRVLGIKLVKAPTASKSVRQVWRQLK